MINKKIIYIIVLFSILISCTQENLEIENETASFDKNVKILNDRLYFESKTAFQNYHNELKDKNEDEVADILDREFYSKGFYSLKPIVNEKTERTQFERHFAKKLSSSINKSRGNVSNDSFIENFDDLEEVFGESIFQSFLNQDAELQIANKIYQYTDHGLFIVEASKYNKLVEYENTKQEVHNLGDVNNIVSRNPCDIGIYIGNENGGYRYITDDIEHYMIEYDFPCGDDDSGGNPIGNPGTGSTPSYNETYAEIAEISNSLDSCSGDEPFLPNLFGTVKVCIDEYDGGDRRVKTKYWDVDFGLGFSIGVKVKHQKKGWMWRKEETDRVALGVNSISWKFDLPSYTPPQNPNYARVYADGLAWEIIRDSSYDYSLGSTSMPNLPFYYDVDAVIEVETFLGEISVNSPLPDEAQVRSILYGGLFDKVKSLMQRERNKELVKLGLIVKTPSHMYVQMYDFSKYCSNCKKQRVLIDWGMATPQITYTFGNGSSNTNVSYHAMDFSQPRSTGANVFGMAKKDGQWHGSRLIFEENN